MTTHSYWFKDGTLHEIDHALNHADMVVETPSMFGITQEARDALIESGRHYRHVQEYISSTACAIGWSRIFVSTERPAIITVQANSPTLARAALRSLSERYPHIDRAILSITPHSVVMDPNKIRDGSYIHLVDKRFDINLHSIQQIDEFIKTGRFFRTEISNLNKSHNKTLFVARHPLMRHGFTHVAQLGSGSELYHGTNIDPKKFNEELIKAGWKRHHGGESPHHHHVDHVYFHPDHPRSRLTTVYNLQGQKAWSSAKVTISTR